MECGVDEFHLQKKAQLSSTQQFILSAKAKAK